MSDKTFLACIIQYYFVGVIVILIFIFFAISFIASTLGAITGIGGGIIIKPLTDAIGSFPASVTSFLSGCTVLSMSSVTLIRNKDVKSSKSRVTYLACGAVAGGVLGKLLMDIIKDVYGNEIVLGILQNIILILMIVMVFIYLINRSRIHTHNIESNLISTVCGGVLGLITAFLGIGGGPLNLVLLSYIFSMDTKTAAKSSIYIIFFSQAAGLIYAFLSGTIPAFELPVLAIMIIGGIVGGCIGTGIINRIKIQSIDKVFYIMLILITAICVCNIIIIS